MPLIGANETGPLSRWSTASEQYLDRSQAGKITLHKGHDLILLSNAAIGSAQSVNGTLVERMAPGLARLTRESPSHGTDQAAGPATTRNFVVAGLAAEAWLAAPGIGVLSAFCPASWHHPVGIKKVLRRITPFLPDVSGMLFVTFTFDRRYFSGPASAHDIGRPFIRKVMEALRRGVEHDGKRFEIAVPYCVKVEFHEDDWAHYHLIVLTSRYIPGKLFTELWGFGRCNVKRINNQRFQYLLKYVTKNGEYPDWVQSRHRLRVFQPSHGFMKPREAAVSAKTVKKTDPESKRASYTIGERLLRWSRMALYNKQGQYRTVMLRRPFQELFNQLILSIAEGKRYLGNGFIKINQKKELIPWILNPLTL